MTSVNLTPITKEDQPTSHVTVGESQINPNDDTARVTHNGYTVAFELDTEEDGFASTIKNKAYINSEIAQLFDGISRSNDFVVRSVSRDEVPVCESATIRIPEGGDEELIPTLRKQESIIHPIREGRLIDGTAVSFEVVGMVPSEAAVRVTDRTNITVRTVSDDEGWDPVLSSEEDRAVASRSTSSSTTEEPESTTVQDDELDQILHQLESVTDQIDIYRQRRRDKRRSDEEIDESKHEAVMEELREGTEILLSAVDDIVRVVPEETHLTKDAQSVLEELRNSSQELVEMDGSEETIADLDSEEEEQ